MQAARRAYNGFYEVQRMKDEFAVACAEQVDKVLDNDMLTTSEKQDILWAMYYEFIRGMKQVSAERKGKYE